MRDRPSPPAQRFLRSARAETPWCSPLPPIAVGGRPTRRTIQVDGSARIGPASSVCPSVALWWMRIILGLAQNDIRSAHVASRTLIAYGQSRSVIICEPGLSAPIDYAGRGNPGLLLLARLA